MFGFGDIDFSGWIGRQAGAIANGLQYALISLIAVLATAIQTLWGALVGFVRQLGRLGDAIWRGVKALWRDHLSGILHALANDYKAVREWLLRTLGPLIKAIKRIRIWYALHILPIQKAIIEIIARIRVALELFRLLGFKWAAKLDADLQTLQGWVTKSITDILGPLNQALTILGIAVDPGLLIRRDFFARSLWNSLGDLKRAAGYGSARPVYASERAQEKSFQQAVWGTQPLSTTGPDGSVTLDPALRTVDDSLTQQMQTLGLAP